jgi:hypothetical protein
LILEHWNVGKATAASLFGSLGAGGLGGVKLKKTDTVLKTMFRAGEGQVKVDNTTGESVPKDPRKALRKLIDFPGDLEEIKKHLQSGEVNPAGCDAYGSYNNIIILFDLLKYS